MDERKDRSQASIPLSWLEEAAAAADKAQQKGVLLSFSLMPDGILLEGQAGGRSAERLISYFDLGVADRGNPLLVEIRKVNEALASPGR